MGKTRKQTSGNKPEGAGLMTSLQGQFLVAMPSMGDARFTRSVLLVVEHNAKGAMAIAIHEVMDNIHFCDVLADISVHSPSGEVARMPPVSEQVENLPVLKGGPVQTGRGFVLHSPDYEFSGATFAINSEISLSANLEILHAIAFENKPERSLFALGYCGWSPGQLENELAQNSWLTVPFDADLLFNTAYEERYEAALGILGIDQASLSAFGGHA